MVNNYLLGSQNSIDILMIVFYWALLSFYYWLAKQCLMMDYLKDIKNDYKPKSQVYYYFLFIIMCAIASWLWNLSNKDDEILTFNEMFVKTFIPMVIAVVFGARNGFKKVKIEK